MVILLGRVCGYAGSGGVLQSGKYEKVCIDPTGFIGAVFVVNVAQLMSQVTASIFPIGFINNHFLYWLLKVMLFIESTGIAAACWPLSWFMSWACGLKKDPFDVDE